MAGSDSWGFIMSATCVDCGKLCEGDDLLCGVCVAGWIADEMAEIANMERAQREARRADRRLVQFKAAVRKGFGVLL